MDETAVIHRSEHVATTTVWSYGSSSVPEIAELVIALAAAAFKNEYRTRRRLGNEGREELTRLARLGRGVGGLPAGLAF